MMTEAFRPQKKRRVRIGSLEMRPNRVVFIIATLSLPLISWAVFWLYVNLDGILLSFKNPRTMEWTMDNFKQVYELISAPGGELAIGFRNTALYFVEGMVLLVLNLVVAFFLYKKVMGYKAFRIIFYLPAIISGVALTTVFQEFIKPQGPLGTIMKMLGHPLDEVGLLGSAKTATGTIMAYCFWTGFSGQVLMFTASFSRIPIDVLEAAHIDGCKPFRELVSLVLPLIMPMFSTMLLLSFTGMFSSSGPILLFTQGNFETTTVAYWLFTQVYGSGGYGGTGSYGLVSALGLCLTVVAVPLTIIVHKLVDLIPAVEY